MAILNRFSAILLCCDSSHFFASRCGISGDSRPAILRIVRFAIRDSVLLRSWASVGEINVGRNKMAGALPGAVASWRSMRSILLTGNMLTGAVTDLGAHLPALLDLREHPPPLPLCFFVYMPLDLFGAHISDQSTR